MAFDLLFLLFNFADFFFSVVNVIGAVSVVSIALGEFV